MTEHPVPPVPDSPTVQRSRWPVVAGVVCLLAGIGLAVGLVYRERHPTPPLPGDLAGEAQADLDRRNYRPLSGPLEALLNDPDYKSVPTQAHPLLGQPAPDFTLSDAATGAPWHLAEKLKDGPVVLVFYYGYICDHCVSQLFALNKDIEKFRELGATVVAVSVDPVEQTRERFKQYGAFEFAVLSDPANTTATRYGTYTPGPKNLDGNLMHGTFVIDRTGRMVWANRGDGPFTQNRTLLIEARRAGARPL
jgi:peroxiredoxin